MKQWRKEDIKNDKKKSLARFEPGMSCVIDQYPNHYTTNCSFWHISLVTTSIYVRVCLPTLVIVNDATTNLAGHFHLSFLRRKLKLSGFRPMYTNTFDTILHAQSVLPLGERYVANDHENSWLFLFVNRRCFLSISHHMYVRLLFIFSNCFQVSSAID